MTTVDDDGVPADDKKIIAVTRTGYECLLAQSRRIQDIQDDGSIYFATDFKPWYYISGGLVRIFPAPTAEEPAALYYIPIPTVAFDDASIRNFPLEYEQLVVLGGAVRAKLRQVSALRDTLADLTVSVTLGESLPTTFNSGAPIFVAPTLDVSAEHTAIATYIDTEEDVELGAAKMQVIDRKIGEFQAQMGKATAEFQEASAAIQAESQEHQLEMGRYQAAVQVWAQDVQIEVQEYQASVQTTMQKIQLGMTEYQALNQQFQQEFQILSGSVAVASRKQ